MSVGERLLKKPVSRVNLETGVFEPVGNGEGTNEDALRRWGSHQKISRDFVGKPYYAIYGI